jgi:protein ImuB
MKIPCYEDLTPGISDVHPRDTFDQVTQLVPSDELVVRANADSSPDPRAPSPGLYACIRARTDATARALMAMARDFSPRIERYGGACIVLDVGGLGRLLGDAHGIAAELQRTADDRGLKIVTAIAPTQTAARLLARASVGEVDSVVAHDVEQALAPVPLGVLKRLVGAVRDRSPESRTFDALRRWGIRTIGEFAALPADDIAARFGKAGLAIHQQARGIDLRPLVADPGVPRYAQSMELEWPIEELEPLAFVLARLLDPLSAALERADKAGAAIRLDLRLVDRTTHSRLLQLPAPIRDARVLRTLLTLDLESHPPSAGIDVVTIEVDPAPSRIVQFSLLERAIPSPETLATLTARLNALVGEERCGSPLLLDSHRPDAFEMHGFNPDERRSASADAAARHAEADRPPLILRRFRPPVAVRVTHDRGRPVHVAIDRRGMPGGRVQQCAGPWRTSGSWWQADGSHWDRDEWDVALSDASLCRLYRDRDAGRWFIEGIFD